MTLCSFGFRFFWLVKPIPTRSLQTLDIIVMNNEKGYFIQCCETAGATRHVIFTSSTLEGSSFTRFPRLPEIMSLNFELWRLESGLGLRPSKLLWL